MTVLLLGLLAGLLAWNVTKEEIFRPLRETVVRQAQRTWGPVIVDNVEIPRLPSSWRPVLERLAYVVQCDFCFSHWAAALVLLVVQPAPVLGSWLVTWGAVVVVATAWTTTYGIWRGVYLAGRG